MNEQKVVMEFLNKIIPDIEIIDGGCKSCIHDFCEGVNESLKDYSLKLTHSEEYSIEVTIETL